MGDKGSFIYGDDICQMVPTFKVEAVDPTAAGDCFTGVLVKQYAETKDIVASARYASAAAAISVQHLGAQPSLPTKMRQLTSLLLLVHSLNRRSQREKRKDTLYL